MHERRSIGVTGVVQGVGFRPFVYALATRLGLSGFVRNQVSQVEIELEGTAAALDAFVAELTTHPPALARIDAVASAALPPGGEPGFRISPSSDGAPGEVRIPEDVATCQLCLEELFAPSNRRFRYPFIACTHCGPRLTFIRSLPFDRENTTLGGFPLCAPCRAEYEDPGDRRFHAQSTACAECGPRLTLRDGEGRARSQGETALNGLIQALREGRIVAVKGLGGYHLACDGRDEAAVSALRTRKGRPHKPFALMVADLAAARALCEVSTADAQLLTSSARPVTLLSARTALAPSVAPQTPWLGVMLPYTPLHHLLLSELEGMPLVLTSANASDAPIAFEDDDALRTLRGVADLFLTHDRPIALSCDDSVVRRGVPLRRARGLAPASIPLAQPLAQPTLAVGGQLKSTFALGLGRGAVVSHHLGDLQHFEAYQAFTQAIAHYERLYQVTPTRLVHDLHPDYASTLYALERGGVELLAVQHHHAHLASCLTDAQVPGLAIGVTFDGTGYGLDGTVWGGEVLVGDCAGFQRAACLRPVPMPGGEQAIREPWRMAVAVMLDAGLDPEALGVEPARLRAVAELATRAIHSPLTSSAGRLFDAVAVMLGGPKVTSFEAQAAGWLEGIADGGPADALLPLAVAGAGEPPPFASSVAPQARSRDEGAHLRARLSRWRLARLPRARYVHARA